MRKTIKQLQGESDYWRVKFINEQKRAEAAEANLAELEKQEPVAWLRCPEQGFHLPMLLRKEQGPPVVEGEFYPVYCRPAPAVSLADLLPTYDEIRAEAGSYGAVYSLEQKQRFLDGGMWVCAAILSNIDGAK